MIENFNYKVVKNFITEEEVKLFNYWCEIKHRTNMKYFDIDQSDNADSYFYGDPIMDSLLLKTTSKVSEIVNHKLLPCYSFTRIYTKFGELKKHIDRPSCELSATLHIGSDGTKWPIFMDGEPIELGKGDCAIYRGTKVNHWREEFNGDWYAQVFLHWVLADGKYSDYYKDKRQYFGMRK